jgi:hypothetical protein
VRTFPLAFNLFIVTFLIVFIAWAIEF